MWRCLTALILIVGLVGCASTPLYTVDDGRPIKDDVLAEILAFGDGQRALRPAIVRSAQLQDAGCQKQWELPFAAFSSAKLPADQRVAWLRALGIDERLRIIASSPASPVDLGDRIMAVGSVQHTDGVERLAEALATQRDAGKSFAIHVEAGNGVRRVTVEPFQVCRGRVQLAVPSNPFLQQYHWLQSIHPLELAKVDLTDDEALWLVLWTQGISEEGAVRMKALQFGLTAVNTGFMLYQLASVANPLLAAGQVANKMLMDQAAKSAVVELTKQQLQAKAKEMAIDAAQQKLQEMAESVVKGQGVAAMQRAAANRGRLTGISRAAATVFDRADRWAAERMPRLQADPVAAFTLHRKLASRNFVGNALIFDTERFEAAIETAAKAGFAAEAYAVLEQWSEAGASVDRVSMPLSTDRRGAGDQDDLASVLQRGRPTRESLPSSRPSASGPDKVPTVSPDSPLPR